MINNQMNVDIIDEIDDEELYEDGKTMEFVTPFDPRQVDIDSKQMVISNIVERLQYGEIELEPDFQRNANLWDCLVHNKSIEKVIIGEEL